MDVVEVRIAYLAFPYRPYIKLMASDSSAPLHLSMQQVSTHTQSYSSFFLQ